MAKHTITGSMVSHLRVRRSPGLNFAYAEWDARKDNQNSPTLSATNYVHMIPLPNGARVLDGWIRATGRTTGQYQVGFLGSLSGLVAAQSMTAAQMTRFNVPAGIGIKVSLTASDVNSYTTVVMSAINMTSASTTGTIALCVWYTVEDQV